MKSVYCAVRTGSLNKAVCVSSFPSLWTRNKKLRKFYLMNCFAHLKVNSLSGIWVDSGVHKDSTDLAAWRTGGRRGPQNNKMLNFIGSFKLSSFLLTKGSIMRDLGVTSQIIMGVGWGWAWIIKLRVPERLSTSLWAPDSHGIPLRQPSAVHFVINTLKN